MPRPRATIFHRHALLTVITTPRAAAASSAWASTVRIPSMNGPVPTRQNRTAKTTATPTRRPHAHTVRFMLVPDLLDGRTDGFPGRPVPYGSRSVVRTHAN